jgi:hypothetical protein
METHGIEVPANRKAITCADCGHVFLVDALQRGGSCSACGNVAYVAADSSGELAALVAKRVLPRLREQKEDALAAFRSAPDGQRVEDFRMRYQVEWQLWAALVRDFRDPALHAAYLTSMLAENQLERAGERYREHRSVMALLDDSRWQAEIADLMLARVEALALSRIPATPRSSFLSLQDRAMQLAPKIFWVALGITVAAKILGR